MSTRSGWGHVVKVTYCFVVAYNLAVGEPLYKKEVIKYKVFTKKYTCITG